MDLELDHTEDSVAIGNGPNKLAINSNGSINVIPAGINTFAVNQNVNLNEVALNTNSFVSVFSYEVLGTQEIEKLKVKADTMGTFRLLVNNIVVDYFQTSTFIRNCIFENVSYHTINTNDIITIEFQPERIELETYNFFTTLFGINN